MYFFESNELQNDSLKYFKLKCSQTNLKLYNNTVNIYG